MSKPQKTTYIARNGKTRFKPSIELVMLMSEEDEGFCIGCGEIAEGVEQDARKYTCDCCGEATVYGAEELALMGLTF